ncbi:replication initiation protein [Stutzerimonas xanthomarina]|uniref:phage/plasmid replication protein, II/X family n=1 Tax=Stutzerimonas nitrititolerans TaxID=2482751 RepID=UPI0008243CA4|nr:phage/plasmid replication protein, II/X family [Stutzerimonas nitrititolerans]OCX15513.1 replication initiation protein [Stutzerimonas xanthomarina]WAD27241.1 phage/plasmid replication protein, II/X family [Pseudomonadaceae bacterium T75]OCX15522.1 replication initiation protein [Stutzerimonas xanthomarina]WAD27251.1 phage/plasmid replication protein, II/X family [Pseudomonadaceae bacterium T75]WAD27261.1 phage/plasmid replication protein, II/X family [Pseudomonadaceae bacterium T75]
MLDKIHLFVPFRVDAIATSTGKRGNELLVIDLEALGVPLRATSVLPDGKGGYHVEDLGHAWESLSTGFTPLAFKVFHQSLGKRVQPGVELKASPAKLLQGHNVFGPTSIRKGGEVMLKWLAGSYPKLFALLDWQSAEVYGIDCTYSARLPDERTALQLVQALRGVSNGQTRNRGDDYETTAYWGSKETRLRKLKAYLKGPEFRRQLDEAIKAARSYGGSNFVPSQAFAAHRLLAVLQNPALQEWAENLLRLEATVMHRWMERRNIPTNLWALCDYQERLVEQGTCFIQWCWEQVTKELFAAFEGISMRVINDDKVLAALKARFTKFGKNGKANETIPLNLFRTYRSLKDYGWQETMDSMSRATFYRHIDQICECGLSKAALQKLKMDDQKNNVVPILRFLQVDFSAQRPDWYVEPSVEAA